jgi:carboxymethylenebutenolidase
VSPAVWGVLELPRTPGPHSGVVLLPGSAGWRPDYAGIARTFADSGFVALAIDYYAGTGRGSSREDALRKWPAWQATVRNAVAYLRASPAVSGSPVGLVGYSQGAFLAVSVASSVPELRAVVDFFGGGGAGTASLEEEVRHFPPLLILHGEADTVVSVRFAQRLREAVLAQGGEVEMHLYPGAHHAFNAPWASTYSEPDAADSWGRTVEFLRRRLAR